MTDKEFLDYMSVKFEGRDYWYSDNALGASIGVFDAADGEVNRLFHLAQKYVDMREELMNTALEKDDSE